MFYTPAPLFVGDAHDDAAHGVRDGGVEGKRIKPGFGAQRGFIGRGVELPIVQIVEQGGELHDEGIRLFMLANDDSVFPHAIDMPPIVTG